MSRYPKGYVKPTDSCDSCLAWGDFSGRLCPACYMFGRSHEAATCVGCRRAQPLKWGYCRLCWCQARINERTTEADVRARLSAIRHHQLFFVGLHYRRGSAPVVARRGGGGAPSESRHPRRPGGRVPAGGNCRCSGRSRVITAASTQPPPIWPARGWPGRSTSPTSSPRHGAGDAASASPSTAAWPSCSPSTSRATSSATARSSLRSGPSICGSDTPPRSLKK